MNFMDYFGSSNPAGGLRMPSAGTGMDLYGGQPSSNLGLSMPRNPYADMETGTGINPPASFGQMPSGLNLEDGLALAGSLLGGKRQAAPQIQPVQLPMGSNQSIDQLLKMYGVRGLLG